MVVAHGAQHGRNFRLVRAPNEAVGQVLKRKRKQRGNTRLLLMQNTVKTNGKSNLFHPKVRRKPTQSVGLFPFLPNPPMSKIEATLSKVSKSPTETANVTKR